MSGRACACRCQRVHTCENAREWSGAVRECCVVASVFTCPLHLQRVLTKRIIPPSLQYKSLFLMDPNCRETYPFNPRLSCLFASPMSPALDSSRKDGLLKACPGQLSSQGDSNSPTAGTILRVQFEDLGVPLHAPVLFPDACSLHPSCPIWIPLFSGLLLAAEPQDFLLPPTPQGRVSQQKGCMLAWERRPALG